MVLICMFLMNEAEQLFTYFRAISVCVFFPCELPIYLICPFFYWIVNLFIVLHILGKLGFVCNGVTF